MIAPKPIAIIEHEDGVSAGHFAGWLAARDLPSALIAIHRGSRVPASAVDFAGICSLGGSMSVNDRLPWIDDELALLGDAVARGVPVIGHCLGGQLLARALGAEVSRSAFKEIGWFPLEVVGEGAEWLGSAELPEIFQWHEDRFDLPPGARRLASTKLVANQAFIVARSGADHLGMQFHVEVTPEIVRDWTDDLANAHTRAAERTDGAPGVQSIEDMLRDLPARTARARGVAWRLYDRWASKLKR